MDTKRRILEESLALFNDEGEAAQTAVDIANALEISPGNLYYHFKGKDAIIRALYSEFEVDVREILAGARRGLDTTEDHWVFAHVLFEAFWDFRFFFRDLGPLTDRYEDIAARFRRLRMDLRATAEALLAAQNATGALDLIAADFPVLARRIVDLGTFWIASAALDDKNAAPARLIEQAVLDAASLVAPHAQRPT